MWQRRGGECCRRAGYDGLWHRKLALNIIVLLFSFCFVLVVVFHVASGAFLWFVRFWRTRERLYINRIRLLLSMRGMLLVSNPGLIAVCLLQRARLKSTSGPSLSMSRNPDLVWRKETGQNWTSLVMTIGLSINGCIHSTKNNLTRENKID